VSNEIKIPSQAINLGAFRRVVGYKSISWRFITQKIDDADFAILKYDQNIYSTVKTYETNGRANTYRRLDDNDFLYNGVEPVQIYIQYAYRGAGKKVYVSSDNLRIVFLYKYRIVDVHRDNNGFYIGETLLGYNYHQSVIHTNPYFNFIFLTAGKNLYSEYPCLFMEFCDLKFNALRSYNSASGIFGGEKLVKQAKKVFSGASEVIYKSDPKRLLSSEARNKFYRYGFNVMPLEIWQVYLS
jgi:hypothetical protein